MLDKTIFCVHRALATSSLAVALSQVLSAECGANQTNVHNCSSHQHQPRWEIMDDSAIAMWWDGTARQLGSLSESVGYGFPFATMNGTHDIDFRLVSLKPESTRHVEFVPKCLYEERSRVGRHWWASNPDSLAPLDRGKHGLDGEPTMHSRRLMMQEQTRHLGRIEGIKPQTSGSSSRRKSHKGLVPPSSTVTSNFSSPKRLCGMAKRPDTKTA